MSARQHVVLTGLSTDPATIEERWQPAMGPWLSCPVCGRRLMPVTMTGSVPRHQRRPKGPWCTFAGKRPLTAAERAIAEEQARDTLAGRDGEVAALALRRAEKVAAAQREFEDAVARCDERYRKAEAETPSRAKPTDGGGR
jgi:hypothetical protein